MRSTENLKALVQGKEMTKEEIQAQIDLLHEIANKYVDIPTNWFIVKRDALKAQLRTCKSIHDLQKEAFEAGRDVNKSKYLGEPYEIRLKYKTFEDYLKTLENDNRS